jgi:hypothetical protein
MRREDEHRKAVIAAVPCRYCLADKGVPCQRRQQPWSKGASGHRTYKYVHGARLADYDALVATP